MSLAKKLSNEAFVSKAPAEVVATEKAKLTKMEGQLAEMDKQMGQLRSI